MLTINHSDFFQFSLVVLITALLFLVAYLNLKKTGYLHYFDKIDKYYRSVYAFVLLGTSIVYILCAIDMLKYETPMAYMHIDSSELDFLQIGFFSVIAFMLMLMSYFTLPKIAFYHFNDIRAVLHKLGMLISVSTLTRLAPVFFIFDVELYKNIIGTPTDGMLFAYKISTWLDCMLLFFIVFCIMIPAINELFIYKKLQEQQI